jgi:integrase
VISIASLPYPVPGGPVWAARLLYKGLDKAGRRVYVYDYHIPGTPKRRRTRQFVTAASDAAALAAFRIWMAESLPSILEASMTTDAATLTAASTLHQFAEWYVDVIMAARGRKDNSRRSMRQMLDEAADWMAQHGVHSPADMARRPGIVTEWAAALTRAPHKPRTVNIKVHSLKWMLTAAFEEGILDAQPVRKWRMQPVPDTVPNPVTPDEVRRFIAYLEERRTKRRHFGGGQYLNALIFMAGTGCRPSDVAGLTWDHVDLTNSTVMIQQRKTGDLVVTDLVGPLRRAIVEEKLRGVASPYVFTDPQGQPWSAGKLGDAVRTHAKSAIGRKVTAKSFRQNIVTLVHELGGDSRDMQDVSGHRSTASEIYHGRRQQRRKELTKGIAERLWGESKRDPAQNGEPSTPGQ